MAEVVGLREEGEAGRERVLGFYCRWADAADDRLRWLPGRRVPERFEDRAQALAWFDGERAGLVAAVQWAREKRFADTAVRLSQCLAVYLGWRRFFDDKITVAGIAREAAHRTGDRHREAIAWDHLGGALQEAGRAWEAIDALTCARDLYQEAGDHGREAGAWSNLGLALGRAGWTGDAIDAHLRARDLFQAVGDRHSEAMAWNGLGLALREEGRGGEAIEAHSKSLAIYQEFEDWYRAGTALQNLAAAHEHADRPAKARAHYLQAAAAYTRANAPTEAAGAQSAADSLT
ncbi:tetratricopeptide repeat protein [Streptomyces prunicolor]|uniref:Tetratricopeptide repeat protein n=1 Tax=Streptomyces prunicolor TaxID=67348 RepID=A0ABU4FC85_9ACTN|nr:tetratricopeptide repeat protein [Streptomyces prunicolor]MDV7217628.1 tetratricopeptide repeat protein [Streptomyces prunicolor]